MPEIVRVVSGLVMRLGLAHAMRREREKKTARQYVPPLESQPTPRP